MKKIIFTLLTLAIFTACEDEDHGVDANNYNGPDIAYYTNGVASSYFVTPNAEPASIQIGATSVSNSDRTYSLQVDAESTAQEGVDFNFVNSSVTIPAGEYFGEILVQGIFEGTTAEGSNLIINLVGSGDNEVMVGASYDLFIVQQCVSDLAGMYDVTTTYGFHDFLPDYSTNTMPIEIVEVDAGLYEVFDFSGGLYSSGPYSAAYGTGDTSFTVQFNENCGNISWEGQSDPWGACIPLDGGTNSVNLSTGVVTISWYCEGYGENGVSVYTPQ
ncbi:hypothetical protein [Pontimicrobium sp. IMCC45349]|uniref:hypothetical protein n=1 Tax=Pontimicrobium sp. IMCC45349 TaxID=3391574 RepID=UPI0039A30ABF